MIKRKDYTNQRFGHLLLVTFVGMTKDFAQRYLCQCDCGNQKVMTLSSIKAGLVIACGCLSKKSLEKRTRHGDSPRRQATREYSSWQHMKYRCLNPKNDRWHRYGGRGITICDKWLVPNGVGYKTFLSDMGRMPSNCNSIDRINNDGNYEPNNCRWATKEMQYANQTHKGPHSRCF